MTELTAVFAATKRAFDLPKDVIYLNGNSLGPMTHASRARLVDEMDNQWSKKLIRGWNESGWYHLPETVGDKIAKLIGAPKSTVTAVDSTSINLFKVITAALALNPERRVILSDNGNFPTDLYVAQGIVSHLNQSAEIPYTLKIVKPEQVFEAVDETVAVVMITQVDYCTGRLHAAKEIVEKARRVEASTILDLCHSAGALEVNIEALKVDFAIGCGYKYFNGGPGAPAFVYNRQDLINQVKPILTGWMGHAKPFDFSLQHTPAPGIERMRVGTPAILGLASLDAALEVWQGITLAQVRKRSIELSELLMQEIAEHCPALTLISPTKASERGSQLSYTFTEGYALVQALIAEGVIGDFRMPNIVRFGIAPLYIDEADIIIAAKKIADVLNNQLWDNEKYKARHAVT